MAAASKFTFDTVFDGKADVVSTEAKARQRRVYTQAEIDAMRAESRAEGFKSGEVRAREALAMAAGQAAAAMRDVLQRSHDEIEAVRAEAGQLAFAAARALANAALAHLPASEVELALRSAMHQAIGEPRLLLRANPAVVEALTPKIEEITHEEGFEGRVQVVGDPNQRNADCRLEWRGGGAERSQSVIETALAELIARNLSRSAPQTSSED
jgi:flagellar assembly protein FliH